MLIVLSYLYGSGINSNLKETGYLTFRIGTRRGIVAITGVIGKVVLRNPD